MNGRAKLQTESDSDFKPMRYRPFVGGIQVEEARNGEIRHIAGATADIVLSDGERKTGFANNTGPSKVAMTKVGHAPDLGWSDGYRDAKNKDREERRQCGGR